MNGPLVAAARFAAGLPRFLATSVTLPEARAQVARQLAERAPALLGLLARAVYTRPESVYARLLARARLGLGDVTALVERHGVEHALAAMYERGVYLTLEEFKGRRAIVRDGVELAPRPGEFDNPLLAASYAARSGGSRSTGTRVLVDLALLAYEAGHQLLNADAFGLDASPLGQWRPVPPGVAGINNALRTARTGRALERWFSQSDPAFAASPPRDALLLRYAVWTARRYGRSIPFPEHVPVADAARVAHWLAACRSRGTAALLDTTSSGAVRVCAAAREEGVDVAGSALRVGGEPFTEARERAVRAAGCRPLARYSMAEVGTIGVACTRPRAIDEVHLLSDKLAVIQRPRATGIDGREVGALVLTTLLPSCPKLMLNVEIDDYAVLDRERCGCPYETLGLGWHAHTIRSFEKLTSEGMSFLGADLLRLVEETLPARFGGDPTCYQLIESELDGLPAVELRVDPRVGALDESALVATVLDGLAAVSSAHRMMAESWRRAGTLRVARAMPLATPAAKILPLHVASTRPRT